jgi:peptidoglycan LD-endopeptidase CwlK
VPYHGLFHKGFEMKKTAKLEETNSFRLSVRSQERLAGVHKDLADIVRRALQISPVDFAVLEGRRTAERQQMLFDTGASRTLNSRHLSGHAVDLGAWVGGGIRWDWPLYEKIALAMQKASADVRVPVVWGGDWQRFRDGPHFQLPWAEYPILRQAQDEDAA